MGEFRTAGSATRKGDLVEITAGQDIYEVPVSVMTGIVSRGDKDLILVRNLQTSLDGTIWTPAGSICMSRTGRSVSIRPWKGGHYVINAEEMRDVLRGNISSATVFEVVYTAETSSKGQPVRA
ncbi:MAG: hypothetical protein ABFC24_08630 [Methanoregulaceae archaeon]